MIQKILNALSVFASDKWAGTVARALAQVVSGLLLGLGIAPEVVSSFEVALAAVLTALFLIVVGLVGSRKAAAK